MEKILIALCSIACVLLLLYINEKRKAKITPRRVYVPEATEGTVPRVSSRRWARANYYSGIISMEELNAFYAAHPEDNSDPDR